MWPKRAQLLTRLEQGLTNFSSTGRHLPGVDDHEAKLALAMQMVSSLRRLDYTTAILARDISPNRADPSSVFFDPERAAILHARAGRVDEACWLIFLAIHFGKHLKYGWQRVRDVYSGLGSGTWTWDRISKDPAEFRDWLRKETQNIGGGFGNHRKYESLRAESLSGTASVIESYVLWIGPAHSHETMIASIVRGSGNDPHTIFDALYNSMRVLRFGRLAKFDYLAMLGRLHLAPIEPGVAYLKGATGPVRGARLLFGGRPDAQINESDLERWLVDMDAVLHIGMQVIEDSICNWQKSPRRFVHFKG